MKYWQKPSTSSISAKLRYFADSFAIALILAISVNVGLKTEVKAAEIKLDKILIEDTEWSLEKQQKTISTLSN